MSRLPQWTVLLLGLVAVSLGCSSDLPEPQWKGEHVVFAAEHPEQVCGGTREYLDRRAGEVLERLGSDPLEIEYYLLDDVDDYCALGPEVLGCGQDGVVFSKTVPHLHEIVHARSGNLMPPVLEEGLATYLGDPYPIEGMAPRERLTELLTSDADRLTSVPEYGRAAHFIAFLSESFGWDSILELDAHLAAKSTAEQVDAAFQAVFGLDVHAVLDAYEEFPECTGIVDTSIACSSSPVASDPFSTSYERVLDCGSSDGVGPHLGMVFVEDVIELGPAIDNTRLITTTGGGIAQGGFALVRRCGPCPENGVVKVAGTGLTFVPAEDFPPGRYLVRLYLPAEATPAAVGVRIDG